MNARAPVNVRGVFVRKDGNAHGVVGWGGYVGDRELGLSAVFEFAKILFRLRNGFFISGILRDIPRFLEVDTGFGYTAQSSLSLTTIAVG